MNTKLVDSIVQLIDALPPKEQKLLHEKIERKQNWQETKERILKRGQAIRERQGDDFYDAIDEVFHQMREERSQELFEACSRKQEVKR
ncbi:hypothetical protein PN466_22470 [Roseofilum reptotaenium CS-1145]|uniref:Uncharacterized protein n=1 Tax=Roseofilum reptotaenium AO1-A TaxID=1925591 RepID=A0A1L9QNE4_9CYAN|nr:hypothetical protein [Roseofilum reptotaenium]MDB9519712.1 hypothetical protein [Roseofilum reptotaenium CS-1145]OJJ24107.1 hypothetical protein BI308_18190 [Roseofilum reptotaenium AO1-A]